LQAADTILLEGAPEDLMRMSEDMELVNLSPLSQRPYRRSKAPLAGLTLAGAVIAAALGIAPIEVAVVVGVALVLVTRCLDIDEAFESVDWQVMALLLTMLAVGAALESSGAISLVVDAAVPWLQGLPPWGVLAMIYLVTTVLTETVSNNAVAVIMAPVAIALAEQLGLNPHALLVVVMFAASASFATPIGYQTNTFVYNAGGYRFTDFMKVGIPLNLLLWLVASFVIPWFWALVPV
jgi:di/tricarboxylate transporter